MMECHTHDYISSLKSLFYLTGERLFCLAGLISHHVMRGPYGMELSATCRGWEQLLAHSHRENQGRQAYNHKEMHSSTARGTLEMYLSPVKPPYENRTLVDILMAALQRAQLSPMSDLQKLWNGDPAIWPTETVKWWLCHSCGHLLCNYRNRRVEK